jgi:hypothetical protein
MLGRIKEDLDAAQNLLTVFAQKLTCPTIPIEDGPTCPRMPVILGEEDWEWLGEVLATNSTVSAIFVGPPWRGVRFLHPRFPPRFRASAPVSRWLVEQAKSSRVRSRTGRPRESLHFVHQERVGDERRPQCRAHVAVADGDWLLHRHFHGIGSFRCRLDHDPPVTAAVIRPIRPSGG